MEKGLKFAIREGGRTIGAGTVLRSLNNRFKIYSYKGLRGALTYKLTTVQDIS